MPELVPRSWPVSSEQMAGSGPSISTSQVQDTGDPYLSGAPIFQSTFVGLCLVYVYAHVA